MRFDAFVVLSEEDLLATSTDRSISNRSENQFSTENADIDNCSTRLPVTNGEQPLRQFEYEPLSGQQEQSGANRETVGRSQDVESRRFWWNIDRLFVTGSSDQCTLDGQNDGGFSQKLLSPRATLSRREQYESLTPSELFMSATSDGRRHSHRRLFLLIGAMLVVGAVVVAGVVITTAAKQPLSAVLPDGTATAQSRTGGHSVFSLAETLAGVFTAESFSGRWISDTENMDVSREGLFIHDVRTNVRTILIPADKWEKIRSNWATLSSSRKYVLCPHNIQSVFRHTSTAQYSIYDIRRGVVIPISVTVNATWQHDRLQYATWLPTRDALVLVAANDIYLRPAVTAPRVIRLTFSGAPNLVYNGIPDWVYEEEVIGSDNTIWLSRDGSMMAYASFNDTQVDAMPLTLYGVVDSLEFQYPITVRLRYPKAGRPNPSVAVYIVDLSRAERGEHPRKLVPVPSELLGSEYILATAGWKDNQSLAVTWMSRRQNHTIISLFDTRTSTSVKVLDDPSVDGTWNDVQPSPLWSDDGGSFITLLQSTADTSAPPTFFQHIHRVWVSEQRARVVLTRGPLTVTEILRWNRQQAVIASERHLYVVGDGSDGRPTTQRCITCNTSNGDGAPCANNKVDFSGGDGGASSGLGGSYYVWTCEGSMSVPRVTLHSSPNHQQMALITDNAKLRQRLSGKKMPRVKSVSVPVGDGLTARVRLLLPPDLDENSARKYPMLVYTYGGPNSQVISEKWSVGWSYHLVTGRNIVYAMIDGRGSGFRGSRILHSIFRSLGQMEVNDQINVTRKLQQIYSFIDPQRTAIWGWSYGGFVTAMAMARDTEDVFRCGISVAPVTNWIYYDTIYTERYMGLPSEDDNLIGYKKGAVNSRTDNFANKQFLLIHGTADDNVHYQQSMMLARSLEISDILFNQQSYPDEAHSLGGTRMHHYHTMERFIESCFQLPRMTFSAHRHSPLPSRA